MSTQETDSTPQDPPAPESAAPAQEAQDSANAAPETEAAKPPFASVALLLEDEQLFAQLTPNSSSNPINKLQLQEQLKDAGYAQCRIDEEALKQVVAHGTKTEAIKIQLGERLSAQAELELSPDKMACHLTITPAFGGTTIDITAVQALLDKNQISSKQLNKDAVKEAIEQSQAGELVEKRLVAEGTPAEHGRDSEFTLLIKLPEDANPTLEEDGTTNYFETRKYPAILPKTELMRRELPTEGSNGVDVQGKELKAKPGKQIKFSKCQGAEVSPADENLLVATQKGHPVIARQGVSVSDTLELKNVDLASGNIHFDGSITILGNVCPRTKVEASGDVFIKGYVENATVTAGNDIVVGAGVISEQVGEEDELVFTSTLKAGGNIQARFFNQTDARANGDISASQYAMNSRLIANHKILLGEGGGKGVLLGGLAFAGEGAEINTMGSSAYVKTELHCASRKRLQHQLDTLEKEQQRRQSELAQLNAFLEKLGEPEKLGKVLLNKARKIRQAVLSLEDRLEKMASQNDSLTQLIEAVPEARVVINRELFPNSLVTINDLPFKRREELKKTTLKVKGKVVVREESQ